MALEAIVGGTVASVLDFVANAGTAAFSLPSVKDWLTGCQIRLIAGRSQPANHDLVRGIRTAHLCAVDVVARKYGKLIEQFPETSEADRRFLYLLRNFLDGRLKVATSGGVDHDVLTVEDIHHVLDDLIHPETTEGYAEQAKLVREAAIERAVREIEEDVDIGRPVPALFRNVFAGDYGPGWYDAFAVYVSEQLKTNERFRSIFFAAELLDVRRAIAKLDERIGATLTHFPELRNFLPEVRDQLSRMGKKIDALPDEIIARLEASGFLRRAESEGLERRAILAIAGKLKPDEVLDFDRAIREIENAVDVALDVIRRNERGSNLDAFVNEVLARVSRQMQAGHLDASSCEIDTALLELERREREDSAALLHEFEQRSRESEEKHRQNRLTLLDAGVKQDFIRRDVPSLVRRVEAIAALVEPEEDPVWSATYQQWLHRYLSDGKARAQNLALEVAIALARKMVATAVTRPAKGHALSLLADGLCSLGQREFGTQRLREAVGAYSESLFSYADESTHSDWTRVLHASTNALHQLGMRQEGTETLVKAVAAARCELAVRRIEREPEHISGALCNLGATLASLEERTKQEGLGEEAIAAYEEALSLIDSDNDPQTWATVSQNLGIRFQSEGRMAFDAGRLEAGDELLEKSIAASRNALEKRDRALNPLSWAENQGSLARALHLWGVRRNRRDLIEQAIELYEESLRELKRTNVPLGWARDMKSLARAYHGLAKLTPSTALYEKALHHFRGALEEVTPERWLTEWAELQHAVGTVAREIGKLESDISRLEEAVVAFRDSANHTSRQFQPLEWAQTSFELGATLRMLAERRPPGFVELEEAISAYDSALVVWTAEHSLALRETALNQIGSAIMQSVFAGGDKLHLPRAISSLREVLQSDENHPDKVLSRFLLGSALVLSAAVTGSKQEWEDGAANLEQALSKLDREIYPLQCAIARFYLGLACFALADETGAAGLTQAEMHLSFVVDQPPTEPLAKLHAAALEVLQQIREQMSKGNDTPSPVAAST